MGHPRNRRKWTISVVIAATLALLAPSFATSSAQAADDCPANLLYVGNLDPARNGTQLFERFNCGTQTRQLTSDAAHPVLSGDLSPDGTKAVVARTSDTNGTPDDGLYILDVATKALTPLPTIAVGEKMYPRWSPDGHWISFFYNDPATGLTRGIYVVNVNGSGLRRITPDDQYGFFGGAAWSHSGDRLAVIHSTTSAQQGIAIVNFDGSGFHDIAMRERIYLSGTPDWTPDDQYVAFGGYVTGENVEQYWVTDPSGAITPLLTVPGMGLYELTIANDWTMYYQAAPTTSHDLDNSHIYRVLLGNLADRTQLTTGNPGGEGAPEVGRTGDIGTRPANFPPGSGNPGPDPTPTTPKPTPTPKPNLNNWQDLGDSFAGAEGAPGKKGFLPGTNVKQNRCHRSYEANAYQTWKTLGTPANFGFHPCSGAVIEDFFAPFPSNHKDKKGNPVNTTETKAQLDWIGPTTKIITVGVSGNNAGFGDVMAYCATRAILTQPTCESVWEAAVKSALGNIAKGTGKDHDNIPDLYRAIRAKAPNAKVYVRGYPRFFSPTRTAACSTGVRYAFFVGSDMRWINGEIDELNGIIKANAKKFGFVYVDMTNALVGHELCTLKPWINSVKLTDQQESFHPNESGQASMAKILLAAMRR